MLLSDILAVTAAGVLIYRADHGVLYEVVGGSNGQINLRKLE